MSLTSNFLRSKNAGVELPILCRNWYQTSEETLASLNKNFEHSTTYFHHNLFVSLVVNHKWNAKNRQSRFSLATLQFTADGENHAGNKTANEPNNSGKSANNCLKVVRFTPVVLVRTLSQTRIYSYLGQRWKWPSLFDSWCGRQPSRRFREYALWWCEVTCGICGNQRRKFSQPREKDTPVLSFDLAGSYHGC